MSIRREQVLIRVRTALLDLEMVAGGKAMTWDGEKITQGKPGSQILGSPDSKNPPPASELEAMIVDLETWCSRAERHIDRGRPKPETKPEELRYRVLNDYIGRRSEKVAEDENCTQKYVEDLRAAHGLTRRFGKPTVKAQAA